MTARGGSSPLRVDAGGHFRGRAMAIIPSARGLLLCGTYVGYSNGRFDLYDVFTALRSQIGYPYACPTVCVFAQLVGGLGRVSFNVVVRVAQTNDPVHISQPQTLDFSDRRVPALLVVRLGGFDFPAPGVYLVELFCNDVWVCDTPLQLW